MLSPKAPREHRNSTPFLKNEKKGFVSTQSKLFFVLRLCERENLEYTSFLLFVINRKKILPMKIIANARDTTKHLKVASTEKIIVCSHC